MAKKPRTDQSPKLVERPQLVEKVYEYKGIKVGVRIDFRTRQITLAEHDGRGAKKWLFANREVEYMEGWRTILHAMEHAITAAEVELRMAIEQEEREKAELMERVALDVRKM